ncbi:hypothetical protein ASZ90_006354 [hydrocarbon metagenome]|uniref:Uncharacterized protein n=1 Tax=hydrocarbon metagenome TaxID=938273 RepID=A0A0W8FSL2_9ZZZZ
MTGCATKKARNKIKLSTLPGIDAEQAAHSTQIGIACKLIYLSCCIQPVQYFLL